VTVLSFRMAAEQVRASFGRLVLSVAAVALGVALVVAIRLMNGSVLSSFLDTADAVAGRAALTISGGEGLTFGEEVVDVVAAVPGVKLAVPLVRAVAFPDDGSGELLTVHGVDVTHDAAVRVYHRSSSSTEVVDDPLVFVSQPDSIILGREFAASRALSAGDPLDLVTPSGVKTFTVRGLLEPEGVARVLRGRLVVMDLYAAEAAFTSPGQINQIDVLVENDAAVAPVRTRIQSVLPPGLSVEEPGLRKDVIRKTIGGFQAMLTGFGLVAVLVGFIICYSRLGAIFERRTWEIGLLRAVGVSRSAVFGELLKESAILGTLGTIVGIPIGIAASRYALPFMARATAVNFGTTEVLTSPTLDGTSIVVGVLVGTVAALLAAAMPALRMARKQPVVALRMRGREDHTADTKLAPLAAAGLVGVSAILLAVQSYSGVAWPGTVVTALIAVAGALLAAPLVDVGGRLLAAPWGFLFGPPGEFAAGYVTQAKRRVALTVSTLGIGLGAVLMFGIVSWSFERTLVAQMTTRLRSDLVVTSMFKSAGWIAAPIAERIVQDIAAVPGVASVAAGHVKTIEHLGVPVLLYGYDDVCFSDARVCNWDLRSGSLPGALDAVASGTGTIVSPSFATSFGAKVGDHVSLRSPIGEHRFVVVGITKTMPDTALVVRRDQLRAGWADEHVTWTYVKTDDNEDAKAISRALARLVGQQYRVQVQAVRSLIDDLADQVHEAFGVVYLMEVITLILVLVAVGDLLTTAVLERTKELGTMRAIGLTRRRLFAMVVEEGAAVGLLGLVLASATGIVLGLLWVGIQFPAILGWSFDLHVNPSLFASVGAATILLCVAGSLLPAFRASRVPVGVALRNE
jgi:putative ABC transport system permease protein